MSFVRFTLALGLALSLLGAWTSTVAASASPALALPPPLAALGVTGPGVASDVQLEIACDDVSANLPATSCRVVARFDLLAVDALELSDARLSHDLVNRYESRPVQVVPGDSVSVDGSPLVQARILAAGERARVELSTTRVLQARERRTGMNFIVPPMRLRHVLFGGGLQGPLEASSLDGRLIEGDAVRVQGAVQVALRAPDFVRVRVDGTLIPGDGSVDGARLDLDVGLDLPWHEPALLQVGGPLLGLGAHFADLDGNPRFLLRLGYEWGIARYLFVSANVESDFASLFESVVVEAATPLLLLLPGAAEGVGVVARQFGDGRADAAFRLRIGAQLPAVGVTVDLDYWPARHGWSGTLVARVSL